MRQNRKHLGEACSGKDGDHEKLVPPSGGGRHQPFSFRRCDPPQRNERENGLAFAIHSITSVCDSLFQNLQTQAQLRPATSSPLFPWSWPLSPLFPRSLSFKEF